MGEHLGGNITLYHRMYSDNYAGYPILVSFNCQYKYNILFHQNQIYNLATYFVSHFIKEVLYV